MAEIPERKRAGKGRRYFPRDTDTRYHFSPVLFIYLFIYLYV